MTNSERMYYPSIAGGDTTRVLALLGGDPGSSLSGKPMPLEQEFTQNWEIRQERQQFVSKYRKTLLRPMLKLIEADKEAVESAKILTSLRPPRLVKRKEVTKPNVTSQIRSGSVLVFRGPPFDGDWSAGSGSNSENTNFGSGEGNRNSGQFLAATQVNTDSGSVWGGAGVAVWFMPIADNTFVRFAAYAPGDSSWDDNSWGYAAHNDAFLGVLIESWNLDGSNHQIVVDRRITLWSDGTGWYEEHGDSLV